MSFTGTEKVDSQIHRVNNFIQRFNLLMLNEFMGVYTCLFAFTILETSQERYNSVIRYMSIFCLGPIVAVLCSTMETPPPLPSPSFKMKTKLCKHIRHLHNVHLT